MKLYCDFEIKAAIENSRKYDLETLVAMRAQMLRHENYLNEQYQFFAVELAGVAYAPLTAAVYEDKIRLHEKGMQKMDAIILRLAA